jgi:hypothetical protein
MTRWIGVYCGPCVFFAIVIQPMIGSSGQPDTSTSCCHCSVWRISSFFGSRLDYQATCKQDKGSVNCRIQSLNIGWCGTLSCRGSNVATAESKREEHEHRGKKQQPVVTRCWNLCWLVIFGKLWKQLIYIYICNYIYDYSYNTYIYIFINIYIYILIYIMLFYYYIMLYYVCIMLYYLYIYT